MKLRSIVTVRRLCREQHADHTEDYDGHVHICSENNFPTAAGLASSAAGYSCLGEFYPLEVHDKSGKPAAEDVWRSRVTHLRH